MLPYAAFLTKIIFFNGDTLFKLWIRKVTSCYNIICYTESFLCSYFNSKLKRKYTFRIKKKTSHTTVRLDMLLLKLLKKIRSSSPLTSNHWVRNASCREGPQIWVFGSPQDQFFHPAHSNKIRTSAFWGWNVMVGGRHFKVYQVLYVISNWYSYLNCIIITLFTKQSCGIIV